jgi:hypothetical protein
MATTLATDLLSTTTADRRARRATDAVISAYVRELAPAAGSRPSRAARPRADAAAQAAKPAAAANPGRPRRHRAGFRLSPLPSGHRRARDVSFDHSSCPGGVCA